MMNSWHLAKKNCICAVILCVCGCILYACKPTPDMETGSHDSDAYSDKKYQRPYVMEKESNSVDYLSSITWSNQGLCSEINGDWFIEDGGRFAYHEEYELPHEKQFKVTWEISLAEMEGTDKLAQEFNRYHEELYESRKTVMAEHEKEVTAMRPEDFPEETDGVQYGDSIRTIASFKWGNIFTVMDIEDMADSNCTAVIANFNSVTGEKYEFADLFNTADYTERLTEILRRPHGYVADADEWNRILHSRFSFALTYRGLLLYEEGAENVLTFAWKDIADILTPELISDVVRYSGWNNPYRRDTETWTGGHLYPIFEANQGSDAMEWQKSSGYRYIEADGEKETEEKWFVDNSDRFSYYAECELEQPFEGYGAGVWEIQLAEMKGTDALAQAVNRYHEELYESRKAQMQVFQEKAAAMTAEEVLDNFGKTHVNLFTMAAFRWGNLFTVVDMDYVGYKGCGIELSASFNMITGEKYEFDDLFQGENYREELLEIIRKEDDMNEYFYWWIDDLEPGGFTYLISYHGLLIGDIFDAKYVLIKWEDMRNILSPEFVSDVLVYTDWNND